MKKGHPHIALFEPLIPQNTGNIARIIAATGCRLHLITPLGFDLSDRQVRRAGLDYWPYLDLEVHSSLSNLTRLFKPSEIAWVSKFGQKSYLDVNIETTKLYVFGKETTGLPEAIRTKHLNQMFHLPMYHKEVRSLNLANSVAIITYHHLAGIYPAGNL